jgi:uncharacterized protein involved in response to NO
MNSQNPQKSLWQVFSAAPHRMMFFAGALQGVLALSWWLADLLGRYTGLYAPFSWPQPSPWLHGFLMIYGFFPFFIFGFLMTVFPNWMNGEKIPPRCYVTIFTLMSGGVALFYAGLWLGAPLLALGALLMLTGWGLALRALFRVLLAAVHPDKLHPALGAAAMVLGWIGLLAYFLWFAGAPGLFGQIGLKVGIWLFLVPTFFAISHRMIPFFTSRVLHDYQIVRPKWALWTVLSCSVAHGLLEIADAARWLWLVDLPFLAASLHLTWHWGIARAMQPRILAVLHIGFAWLSVALALYAAQSLAALAGWPLFGQAPLHALTVGFFASMLLAMATRVTLGHAGFEMAADGFTWALFLGFQGAALARVVGDLPLPLPRGHLFLLAAAIWLLCFIPWVVKYAPLYWRPRADGEPG